MADKVSKIKIGADTTEAKLSIGDLNRAADKEMKEMSKTAEIETKKINSSFKRMGIRMEQDINKSSKQAKADFLTIKNSGVASARDIRIAHDKMATKIKANNAELRNGSRKLRKEGGLLSKSFAPIAAAYASIRLGTKAITESVRFESALLDLQKVLSDSEGDAKQFIGTVDDLAKEYGESAVDILQGAANFKQAGFTVQEAFKLQEESLKLVIAGGLEAAQASELLVSVLKGFKAPASDAARLIDVLNEVSNNYATNVQELAQGMADLSPVANKMGFTFEETAGLLTPVIEVFRSGSESAQALRTGLLKLISDEKPVEDALESLGVAQKDLNGNLRSGKDILLDVSTAFTLLDTDQKLFFTSQLVGTKQTAKMSEVFDGLSKTMEITNVAMGAAGSAAKEVAIRMASTEKQIDRLKVSAANVAKIVGDELNPAFRSMVKGLTDSLPFILKLFFKLRKAQLETQASVLKTTGFFVAWLDIFVKGKPITDTLNDAINTLNEEILNVGESQKRDTRAKEEANEANKRLASSTKELTEEEKNLQAEIRKRSDALEKQIALQKEHATVAAKAASESLSSLQKQAGSQTKLTNEIKLGIKQHEDLLTVLRKEVETAGDFANEIDGIIKDAEIAVSQSGLGEVAKLTDNLSRTFDEFNQGAANALAEGNVELARTLTREAATSAKEILEAQANKIDLQVAGKQVAGLDEAAIKANEVLLAAKEFSTTMKEDAQEAVAPVSERLTDMVTNLGLSEDKLKSIDVEIKTTQILVDTLNAELGKDITKNVTVVTTNVQGLSEGGQPVRLAGGGKVPGSGSGDKIHAMLDPREVVINPKAVSAFSLPAALAFNNRDLSGLLRNLPLPTERITKMQEGGEAQAAFDAQQGGQQATQAPSETIRLELGSGQNSLSTIAPKGEAEAFLKQIKILNANQGRRNLKY